MDRVTIADGLTFSRIVYGMWRLGDDANTSPEHVIAKVKSCLDQQITTFDQADIYGGYMAEEIFGAALARDPGLRNEMEIVTKCDIIIPAGRYSDAPMKYYDTTAAHVVASVDHSLRLMGIDHIDVLLIHRPDPLMDHDETGAALDGVIKSGKVRHVGVSNFRPHDWSLLQSAMKNQLVTNQIEVSLANPPPFTNGDLAFHQQHRHPIMAWSPLGGGSLMGGAGALEGTMDKLAAAHGVDRATIAVAFLLRHPAKILPVMGTNNLERIASFSKALDVSLTRPEWFSLYEAAQGFEVP